MTTKKKPRVAKKAPARKPPTKTVLVLRTCAANMTSAHDPSFKWPKKGPVTCAEWDPEPVCGGGLHGLLWGNGDARSMDWTSDHAGNNPKWLVVEVDADLIVPIDGKLPHPPKVKFPRGVVLYAGDRKAATDLIASRAPATHTAGIHGVSLIVGDGARVTGGYRATVTGGDYATVTGGYRATVTGGDYATVTGGYRAKVTGGDGATVTGGVGATVTGGVGATVTGGDCATVTGGDRAKVTGGDRAKVTGGVGARLILTWWDGKRYRTEVAYVGEGGIEPNVAYKLNGAGKWVKA